MNTCKVVFVATAGLLVLGRLLLRVPAHANPPDATVSFGSSDWETKLRSTLDVNGYAHVASVLNRTEVQGLRDIAHGYCYGNPRKALGLSYGGYTVPAFIDIPEFKGAKWVLEDPRLHRLLHGMFGGPSYRFASHNDVSCDFVGVWHKDVLRGEAAKYQECDIWSPDQEGEKHDIYKVLFYLQDHENDELATKVIPGSHVQRRTPWETGYVAVRPMMGDAIVIDQRISHAGNQHYDPFGQGRLFLQLGFGRKNRFTDEFERGTIVRQQKLQSNMLQAGPMETGLATLAADIKMTVLGSLFTALPPQLLNYFSDAPVAGHLGRSCEHTSKPTGKPQRADL